MSRRSVLVAQGTRALAHLLFDWLGFELSFLWMENKESKGPEALPWGEVLSSPNAEDKQPLVTLRSHRSSEPPQPRAGLAFCSTSALSHCPLVAGTLPCLSPALPGLAPRPLFLPSCLCSVTTQAPPEMPLAWPSPVSLPCRGLGSPSCSPAS